MTAPKYTAHTEYGGQLLRSRKDDAIKAGLATGGSFYVTSPSGARVYTYDPDLSDQLDADAAAEEQVEEEEETPAPAPEPEPTPEPKFDLDKMKAKIKALLDKAESTTHPQEAEALTAKAETLMLKLGVTVAELQSVGKRVEEPIVQAERTWRGSYARAHWILTEQAARGFGNLTVLRIYSGPLHRRSYIIGFRSDVETFLQLLDSLTVQVQTALHAWQEDTKDDRRGWGSWDKSVAYQTYIQAYGVRVGERLADLRTVVEAEASPGAALVLRSKSAKVDDWKNQQYPNLKKGKASKTWDHAAAGAGYNDGGSADLGQTRLATAKAVRA